MLQKQIGICLVQKITMISKEFMLVLTKNLQPGEQNSSSYKPIKQNLPPKWVDRIDELEADIHKIKLKISELSTLHTKRLMVNFESDEVEQEREIDAKTHEITRVFHHAEKVLKRFGVETDNDSATADEKKVRKNMQMSMAKKLQSLSMSFRNTQKNYMKRLTSQKQGHTGGAAAAFDFLDTSAHSKSSGENNNNNHSTDMGFSQMEMYELENTEKLVNERDAEITNIAKSIDELAAIFRELAVLVIDQGTILDRIDYNMETAVDHVKKGVQQLEKAETHQKNAMSVKCIALLVVLIIIMMSVLIWKHS